MSAAGAPLPPDGENAAVASMLHEAASLLEAQGGNPFRAAAFRRGGDAISALHGGVREILDRDGLPGLEALPGIGPGIAAAIAEMLATGRWGRLEHLRGDVDAESLLRTVPGVGPELAREAHETLGISTLEALEAAAHDGRLQRLPHVGPRRAAALRATLTGMLDRTRRLRRPRMPPPPGAAEPPLALLLDVDREYRERAAAGTLPTIAPRRFNPSGEAWLPVLHAQRGDWHVTALYSNTARAHELGRERDWVVLYTEHPEHGERQYTAVTARGGPWAGQRIVRGREAEQRALAGQAQGAGG